MDATIESMEPPTDLEAFQSFVASRRKEAWTLLYERYARRIHGFCLGLLGNASAAEDATQEVFLELIRTRNASDIRNFRSWLYQVAYRTARKTGRRAQQPAMEHAPDLRQGEGRPVDELAAQRELQRRLRTEIDALDDARKIPLTLRYQHGLSFREIADVLGEPEGTVSRKVFEARQTLKERLSALAVVLPLTEEVLKELPLPPIPPTLATRLAQLSTGAAGTVTPGVPAKLALWGSVPAAILLIALVVSLKRGNPDPQKQRVEPIAATGMTPAAPPERVPSGSDPDQPTAPDRTSETPGLANADPGASPATFRITPPDGLPVDEIELQIHSRIHLKTFTPSKPDWVRLPDYQRGDDGFLEEAPIPRKEDGSLEVRVPCTEPTLCEIQIYRKGYSGLPLTRWVVARPGETFPVTFRTPIKPGPFGDLESILTRNEAEELLLTEMKSLWTFGGIRGKCTPGGWERNQFRFRDKSLVDCSWPMVFWEGDQFLMLPLPSGMAEIEILDDCCRQTLSIPVMAGQIAEIGLVPHRPSGRATLSGIVLDPSGLRVRDASITLREGVPDEENPRFYHATSGEDGRFAFDNLDPQLRKPTISIEAPGFPYRVGIPVVLNQQNLILELRSVARMRVTVLSEEGPPPGDVSVRLKGLTDATGKTMEIEATAVEIEQVEDDPPIFEVRVDVGRVPARGIFLDIRASGFTPLELGGPLTDGEEKTIRLEGKR